MSIIDDIFNGAELTCIDAGAAGGLKEIPKLRKFTNLISFEPLPESCNELKSNPALSRQFKSHKVFPFALYSSEHKSKLFIANKPSMSSMLEFDEAQFDFHFGFSKGSKEWKTALTQKGSENIKTITLNKFTFENKIDEIDFLKLDTQGTELEILKGANNLLDKNKISVIKTEFSNIPVYKNQCVFSEIDNFLKSKGFMLIDCIYYPETIYLSGESSKKTKKKLLQESGIGAGGDAVYILDKDVLSYKKKVIGASILASMGYTSAAMEYLKPALTSGKDQENFILELVPENTFKNKIKKFIPPVIKEILRKK